MRKKGTTVALKCDSCGRPITAAHLCFESGELHCKHCFKRAGLFYCTAHIDTCDWFGDKPPDNWECPNCGANVVEQAFPGELPMKEGNK